MDKVRIGTIGAGHIVNFTHLPAFATDPRVELIAVADLREQNAQQTAAKFGAKAWYADYHDLLRRDDVDAVVVATPHPLHSPIATDVLKAGKHVLVQKPMATKQEDADLLVETAQASDRVAMAMPFYHFSAYSSVLDLVREGAIGKIIMARSRVAHAGAGPVMRQYQPGGPEEVFWFYDPAKSGGGGVLYDLGVYSISMITYLIGPIKSVCAQMSTALLDIKVEENATLAVAFQNGAIGTVDTSWCEMAGDEQVALYGSEGTIYIRGKYTPQVLMYSKKASFLGAQGWITVNTPGTLPGRQIELHRHFVDCIVEGKKPACTVEQGRHVVEVMLGAYRSARTGVTVPVNSTF